MEMMLRDDVAHYVDQAIRGSAQYKGNDPDLNRNNWVQIVTDRIIGSFVAFLPPPVDIDGKYENTSKKGLYVAVGADSSYRKNQEQLMYLSRYASDKGYNSYYEEIMEKFSGMYGLNKSLGFVRINTEGKEDNGTSTISQTA